MTDALSPAGLQTLHDLLAAHVTSGQMPGLVALVARGDAVHVEVIGAPAFADTTTLSRDAIFRIASLTKPVTAATAMSLVDDGLVNLEQPVDDVLPELAKRRVLRAIDAELDNTVPAHRSITVEDLLTSCLGFGSVMAPPGTYPIQRAETDAGLQSIGGPPWPPVAHDADSWIAALGALPLMYQPGERWCYNTSSQVLGVLIARVAGKELPAVLRERIFEPLGMADTGFSVPAAELRRLTTFYAPDAETGDPSLFDEPAQSWWRSPPRFPDASGWLVSTIDDYWTFVQMLLSGGSLRGARILSPDSVARMTADQLTPSQRADTGVFLGEDASWGYGMEVTAAGSPHDRMPCGFGWDGGSGTTWHSDRELGVTGILLTQRAMTSPEPPRVMLDFWTGVNAAINRSSKSSRGV